MLDTTILQNDGHRFSSTPAMQICPSLGWERAPHSVQKLMPPAGALRLVPE